MTAFSVSWSWALEFPYVKVFMYRLSVKDIYNCSDKGEEWHMQYCGFVDLNYSWAQEYLFSFGKNTNINFRKNCICKKKKKWRSISVFSLLLICSCWLRINALKKKHLKNLSWPQILDDMWCLLFIFVKNH